MNEKDFTRPRGLPLPHLIPMMLNLRKGTLQDELDQFFETLGDGMPQHSVTAPAFCQARQKLRYEAFIQLNAVFLESVGQHLYQKRWHGYRVVAVDGSTARLPNHEEIERYFGRPSGSGVPLARFSRLYDVLNQIVIRADMAPYDTSERELAADYLPELNPDDLVLYDRGYPAFWLLAYHREEGRDYCMRLRKDFHPEVKAFLASGKKSDTVMLHPNRQSAKQCEEYNLTSDSIPVRLIRVELKSGETEVLATSLLDESVHPTHRFGQLYSLRWGIEENYKREKRRLEIENFSGRSPHVLLQDFHAKILAQNLTAIFVCLAQWLADEQYRHRKHRYAINFAHALSKMKNNLIRLFLLTSPLEIAWRLLEKIASSVEAVRPGRSYPRNMKKVRVPGFQENYKRTR